MSGERVGLLDHGFIQIRNLAGPTRRIWDPNSPECDLPYNREFDADDSDVPDSARMSFDRMGIERTREEDERLAKYLMRNRHSTPFESIECWIEMKMPIFVARQFVRHRTVTINEVSARYVQLPAEWYVPDPRVVGARPERIKQGRMIEYQAVATPEAVAFCAALNDQCAQSYALYQHYLNKGIPPELARCFLHVNHYTHWLWKQDLHNMMHFLSLRAHSHAQYEAQQYGYAVMEELRKYLPHSIALFEEFRKMPD